jgi:hypothetical protein
MEGDTAPAISQLALELPPDPCPGIGFVQFRESSLWL